jgi:hypothetical protein
VIAGSTRDVDVEKCLTCKGFWTCLELRMAREGRHFVGEEYNDAPGGHGDG